MASNVSLQQGFYPVFHINSTSGEDDISFIRFSNAPTMFTQLPLYPESIHSHPRPSRLLVHTATPFIGKMDSPALPGAQSIDWFVCIWLLQYPSLTHHVLSNEQCHLAHDHFPSLDFISDVAVTNPPLLWVGPIFLNNQLYDSISWHQARRVRHRDLKSCSPLLLFQEEFTQGDQTGTRICKASKVSCAQLQ